MRYREGERDKGWERSNKKPDHRKTEVKARHCVTEDAAASKSRWSPSGVTGRDFTRVPRVWTDSNETSADVPNRQARVAEKAVRHLTPIHA